MLSINKLMNKIKGLTYLMALAFLVGSCARNPYAQTNRIYKKHIKTLSKTLQVIPPPVSETTSALNYAKNWVGTTNFNLRRPNLVIVHHTAQDSVAQTLKTFTLERTQVSAHYVIAKNGEVYQMLHDLYRGWHGGNSRWGSLTDINSGSIGIELDNNGFESFSEPQIESLLALLHDLKAKYNIPTANFIGHSDIAPTRKNDPNPSFPWKILAQEGYGLWYDEINAIKDIQIPIEIPAVTRPQAKDSIIGLATKQDLVWERLIDVPPTVALRIIGYDVSDLPAAIKAFKLHFIQTEVDTILTNHDLKVLNNLYKKYM